MIVLNINGKRTEITGWRAWLIGAIAIVPLFLIFAAVAFFLIGLSITVGTTLLLLIPAIIVVAIVGSLVQRQ